MQEEKGLTKDEKNKMQSTEHELTRRQRRMTRENDKEKRKKLVMK